jgi:hypothetical protein
LSHGCSQFSGAIANGIFESGALVVEKLVRTATLEQITNTQRDLNVIERLEQEVGRAGLQPTPFGFLIRVRSQNHDRQKCIAGIGTDDNDRSRS